MIYKNAKVNGELVDIETENGTIVSVGKLSGSGIDMMGHKVYPGLFDIHAHGCVGCDTMDGDHLAKMSAYLAKNGTTSWLPTTMTVAMEDIEKVVSDTAFTGVGANVVGFHAEGPYVSQKYKGAQNEKFIRNPNFAEFSKLKNIKMVTLAPEKPGAMEFIKSCDCVVSLGHTDASYDCAKEAILSGAACITHTFNAMAPLHHREPGAIGAAIDTGIYVQVIADGVHMHPAMVRMLYKLFGPERMILISDSMCATGLSDGEYMFGGQPITVTDSVARTKEGAIAGSTSTLFTCVKKAIEFGIPEEDAFRMASLTPATLMGEKKGKIAVGYDAEFIAVDENLELTMCVVGGEKI
ncbi:MAG: N-acetylglucosamine-6-phosphate deacetylase [Clostridia bacterium]|nr:N-acetylglucosamine-6-phosphate deacetylase [Clostridia bacterium]